MQGEVANPFATLAWSKFCELSPERQGTLMRLFLEFGDSREKASLASGLRKNLLDNPVLVEWAARLASGLSDRSLDRLTNAFLKGEFVEGERARAAFKVRHGVHSPATLVVNPTMRCNLACSGCYARAFPKSTEMDYGLLQRILRECREIGTRFITVSGGEPFLYPHLVEMARDFEDLSFLVFTNATLITDAMAAELGEVGNIFPALSVEGFEEETDARRGSGVHASVLAAMARLRGAGVLFGFSATATRTNCEILCEDRFVDYYLDQGVYFGWIFQHLPIGRDPDVSLMPTPEQRNRLRLATKRWQVTRPLFVGDFWNDGPCVAGCLSAARYAYVCPNGDVTPCTFVHFTTHNLQTSTLTEIWNSELFRAIRARQPYRANLLRPCKIIDEPQVLREVVKTVGARPTYRGADAILRDPGVIAHLDAYAERWGELADEAWAGEDYQSGHSVLVPFLGRLNVHEQWRERMRMARRRPAGSPQGSTSDPASAAPEDCARG